MYQPTKLLPREKGLPYGRKEIILEQVRREEHRYTFIVPNELPPQVPKLPISKRIAITANWVKANIVRESISFIRV